MTQFHFLFYYSNIFLNFIIFCVSLFSLFFFLPLFQLISSCKIKKNSSTLRLVILISFVSNFVSVLKGHTKSEFCSPRIQQEESECKYFISFNLPVNNFLLFPSNVDFYFPYIFNFFLSVSPPALVGLKVYFPSNLSTPFCLATLFAPYKVMHKYCLLLLCFIVSISEALCTLIMGWQTKQHHSFLFPLITILI